MFLNRLEKEEKIAFLELAHYVARSDNDFSLSQKDIINNYCIEMQIENIEFNVNKFDIYNTLEKILEEFNLNYHLATVYGEWAKAILSLYIQGNALVEL